MSAVSASVSAVLVANAVCEFLAASGFLLAPDFVIGGLSDNGRVTARVLGAAAFGLGISAQAAFGVAGSVADLGGEARGVAVAFVRWVAFAQATWHVLAALALGSDAFFFRPTRQGRRDKSPFRAVALLHVALAASCVYVLNEVSVPV